MGMQSSKRDVVHVSLICDNCERRAEFDVLPTDSTDPEAFGWLEFNNPVDAGSVTFHTKRCAIGFFRDVVEQATEPDEDEEDEDDSSEDHTIDQNGDQPQLVGATVDAD